MSLTEAQSLVLTHVARVCDSPEFGHEFDGVSPRRGQHQLFDRLALRGLLECCGPGEDDHGRAVQIYVITKAGRKALGS